MGPVWAGPAGGGPAGAGPVGGGAIDAGPAGAGPAWWAGAPGVAAMGPVWMPGMGPVWAPTRRRGTVRLRAGTPPRASGSLIRDWQPRPRLRTGVWPECASTMPRALDRPRPR